jgi:hypothetical protein
MSRTGELRMILAGSLLVAACRLGGPPGWSPRPPDAATADAPAVDAPTGGGADDVAPAPPEAGAQDASGDAAVAGCMPPFAAEVCDPVCNTGCPPLSRCDVSEQPRRGACVGIWVVGEGGGCFRGSTTDSCAVRLTCLDGRCRRLCYRDADCTAGSCCSRPLDAAGAPSGFAVCAPCDPPPR